MGRKGMDMLMIEQILKLKEQGKSRSAIAKALGVTRNTVKKYLRQHFSNSTVTQEPEAVSGEFDWPKLSELVAKGVTLTQLHADYAANKMSYWSFRRRLINFVKRRSPEISLRQEHLPGEASQIDFADGIALINPKNGDCIKTQLFCLVLPFSSMTYAEFVLDQKLNTFLAAQDRAWRFLGGVTPYVVIDNLKAGVTKAHRYDPVVNPTYVDFANHYGFAVLPARPYHPKDKASVEAAIGVLQRTFYQQVREKKFYFLESLNGQLWTFLEELHAKEMKDYGVSRDDRFEIERPKLLPLPATPYEICEWREAKAHPDCCVQITHCLYSVPHIYVGQILRIKLTGALVSIFNAQMELIASHPRLSGKGQVSMNENHYPDYKMQLTRYQMQKIKEHGDKIGPKTTELIKIFFSDPRPLKYLRRLQGMMRIYDKKIVSQKAMEYAASQAITFQRFQLAFFESCAKKFDQTKQPRIISAPERSADEVYLHQKQEK